MAIFGVRHLRPAKGRDRRLALAELFANFAERKPGGGKAGRQFGRLQQQIGGGDEIALELQIAGEIEPPVGHQIAGGQEQSHGHGRNSTGFTSPRWGESEGREASHRVSA